MAAAAACNLKGGTPEPRRHAAMALGNLLGDATPWRVWWKTLHQAHVVGAVNAVSCANMALAGVDYAIPCDEVIDAMGRVGSLLSLTCDEIGPQPPPPEALKTAECNACMKRIVAAPTAGSCGVLPAVLLPLARAGQADEDAVCDALYVAAGFGQVIAARATLAGAEGGCQAEVGAASAMAAAALCNLKGGTPEQCAAAAAMALGNLLGLVCDPVAGLVEVPCIKRNVVGAVNAVSCANMALAGVDYAIPCDEVIDAMGRVGSLLSPDLRETGQGGLAATPTGVKIARQLAQED